MASNKDYIKKYSKEHLKRISLAFNLEKDKDILDAIEKAGNGNTQQGIKVLIRSAINRDIV